jgi:hypothetical protein
MWTSLLPEPENMLRKQMVAPFSVVGGWPRAQKEPTPNLRGSCRCSILPATRKGLPAQAGRDGGRGYPYLLERHKVDDYTRWREVFDADASNRVAAGCRGALEREEAFEVEGSKRLTE